MCIVHSMMYIVEACVCVFICVRCRYVLCTMLVCKALRALKEKGRYINVCYYYYYYFPEMSLKSFFLLEIGFFGVYCPCI